MEIIKNLTPFSIAQVFTLRNLIHETLVIDFQLIEANFSPSHAQISQFRVVYKF